MEQVLAGVKYVSDNSRSVKLDKQRLKEFCKAFNRSDAKHWLSEAPFDFSKLNSAEEKLNFLFAYSSIGFCYWGDPQWSVGYKGQNHCGSFGMIAALGKAVEAGVPLLDPKYRSMMSRGEFEKMLEGNITIPLFEARLGFVHESGSMLLDRYDSKVSTLVEGGGGDAIWLVADLGEHFSAFQDNSSYHGQEVLFYKKAQLFVSDVCQLFGGEGLGHFYNAHELTALADYRIPQVLRRLGILSYSKELADRIDRKIIIPKGSEEEVELRANMVWAVQLMYEQLKDRMPGILPIEINDHLWLLRRQLFPDDNVHHRTLTTAY